MTSRCVQNGSAEVCLDLASAAADAVCQGAEYNGEACARCVFVPEGLCDGGEGYALDCSNVVRVVDMTVCGDTLSGRVPSSGGGGGVKTGVLVFFLILFFLAVGVWAYIEVRKRREGLEPDDNKETDNDSGDVESGDNNSSPFTSSSNIEEPLPPEEPRPKKNKKSQPPEEPIPKNSRKGLVKNLSGKLSSFRNKDEDGEASKEKSKEKKSDEPLPRNSLKGLVRSLSDKFSKKGDDDDKNDSSYEPPVDGIGQDADKKKKNKMGKGSSHHSRSSRGSRGSRKSKKMDPEDEFAIDGNEVLPGDTFEAFDETKGDPKADALLKYHRQGDWEPIRDFFHKIRRRIIERQHYITLLVKFIEADWPGPVDEDTVFCDYLDDWNEVEPENLQCNVLRLEVWAAWAWHGRTTAFAHEIPPERVELFYARMDRAAAELARVLTVTKKRDALLYAAAIKIATGRNDEQSVVQQYMEAVQASNDPANFVFHTRAMEYFCEKWHGSNKEMLNYARWITDQLPDGHPLWILIPAAHYEVAISMNNAAQRSAYWQKHRDAIVEAYEKALAGPWETKVNDEVSPACKNLDAVVRNWFVYALGKARVVELAQKQARVIGKTPLAELPWDERYTYTKHVKNLGFSVDS